MKRCMAMVLAAIVTVSMLTALPLDYASSASYAMADAGLALDYAPDSFTANPAQLALGREVQTSFISSVRYRDALSASNFSSDAVNPLLQSPVADWMISFTAGSLAFSMQSRTALADRSEFTGYSEYTGNKTTLLQLDWATGKQPFYFGLSARVLAESERSAIRIRSSHTLLDYLIETTVGSFESVQEGSRVEFGLGLLLDYQWFKMGVVTNRFAQSSLESTLIISVDSLVKTLDWGFALSSPTYDANNQLHLLKVEGALDFINLGSNEERETRFGLALKLQLLPEWSTSLLVGYREPESGPSDLLHIEMQKGVQTVGLAARLNMLNLSICYAFPTSWYLGESGEIDPALVLGATLSL